MVAKKSLLNLADNLKKIVDARVIDSIARYDQVPLLGESYDEVWQNFAEIKDADGVSYVERLSDIFRTGISDNTGKFAEYRFANFILSGLPFRLVPKIDFRVKIPGSAGPSHEFDIVGFDSKEKISFVAEVKDRKSNINKTDIFKFLSEIEDILSLKVMSGHAYYGSSSLFTDDAKMMIANSVDKKGNAILKRFRVQMGFYEN